MSKSVMVLMDGSIAVSADEDTFVCVEDFDYMKRYKSNDTFRYEDKVYIVTNVQDVYKIKNNYWRFEEISIAQLEYIHEMQKEAVRRNFHLPEFKGTTKGEASDYIRTYEGKQYR